VSEVVRESIFLMTEEEVPYATYVEVYSIETMGEKMKIGAYIHCETDSQKGILVGKAGAKITAIGKRSREELMKIFDQPIDLFLRVKVSPRWKKTADSTMRALGMK
jgi:GTP-binding protein Era